MQRSDKERIVDELAGQLSSADTLIVADYRGLTNKQLEALRDVLLEHGARFRIVKNTLTQRAAEQAGIEPLLVMLEGPTAIAFIESDGDPAAVAKALAATAKETNVLVLRGGVFEGRTLTAEQVSELATLPPLDVLRGQVLGAVVAPLTQLLAIVAAPLQDLRGLVDARIKQLEEQGEVVEQPALEQEPVDDEPVAEGEDAEPVPAPAGSADVEPATPDAGDEPEPQASDDSSEKEEEEQVDGN